MDSKQIAADKESTSKLLQSVRPLPAFDIQFVELRVISEGKYEGKRFQYWHASTFRIDIGGKQGHSLFRKVLGTPDIIASIVWQDGRFLLLPAHDRLRINGSKPDRLIALENGDTVGFEGAELSIRLEAVPEHFGNLRLKPAEEKMGGVYDGLKRFCRSIGIMRPDDTV